VFQPENFNQTRADESYKEDWRSYYAERQSIIRRLGKYAAGAFIPALLIAVLPGSLQVQHPLLMNAIGAVGMILLLATAFQWFMFNWTLGGWTCPRCREPFFHSTFVRNPFWHKLSSLSSSKIEEVRVGVVFVRLTRLFRLEFEEGPCLSGRTN
jgi:hypothetical protein